MKVFSLTDVGRKREINQDSVFVSDEPIGNIPNLFVVADGMGGHKAGDYASRYAVKVLQDRIRESDEMGPEAIITDAVKEVNHKIIEAAASDVSLNGMGTTLVVATSLNGMGTTLVVATIIEHTLYFANVGDSRLYLIRDEIKQLSRDHSLVQEMVRLGGIKQEEAKYHPDKNVITRAIGAKEDVEVDFFDYRLQKGVITRAIGAKEDVEVDFFDYRLQKGDTILMCSDGLTDMVDDDEIFRIVKSGRDIVETAKELVEKANENGGKDNIGIVLVQPFAGEVSI